MADGYHPAPQHPQEVTGRCSRLRVLVLTELCRRLGYLHNQPSASGFWTVEYYQQFFDVDTKTVLMRCYAALVPTNDFVADVCDSKPDMYGPFWTLTVSSAATQWSKLSANS